MTRKRNGDTNPRLEIYTFQYNQNTALVDPGQEGSGSNLTSAA